MSIVNTETGEIITTDDVRQSVRRVIEHAESIWDEWAWQVENKTWGILGYSSWDEMRTGEYASLSSITAPRAERPELISRFRKAGLTQAEAAETLGVSRRTVQQYDEPTYQKRSSALSQTPAPADDREADAGAGLPTPVSPFLPQGEAGPDSSGADAVGATAPEGPTPAAEFEPEPANSPAPRPQESEASALDRFLDADPSAEAREWRKNFWTDMSRASRLCLISPEAVAEKGDPDTFAAIERHAEQVARWADRVKKAQPQRLTVLRGGVQ